MRLRTIILVLMIVSIAGVSLAQSHPHLVYGVLRSSDGGFPNPECIIFNAWITGRPTEILTQDSLGCSFEDSFWFVNTGNFDTEAEDDAELNIWFRDTCEAETLTVVGNIDLSYPEENWGASMLVLEGFVEREIELTAPNGGDDYLWDDPIDITWTSDGPVTDVEIEYSSNDGGSWETIIASTGNDGIYEWTAPHISSDEVLFRVTDIDDPPVFDVSDGFTSINPSPVPTIEMVYPNGGEVLFVDSTVAILWNATDIAGSIELFISQNAGVSWISIADGLGARGVFDWTVIGPVSEECLMRVVSDDDTTLFDDSDDLFEIAECIPPVPDTIVPAQIVDLVVVEVEPTRAHLAWTAPGDDGMTGAASLYTLGYDDFGFDWPATWEVAGMPAPDDAGTPQDVWIEGLTPETDYWAAMKSQDEVPNISDMSNMVEFTTPPAPDIIPPAAFEIDTLVARDVSFNSFTIYWDAPGDDGAVGTANIYDFRLSETAFIEGDFETIGEVTSGVPEPLIAGTRQTLTVDGLEPDTDYWIAGRAFDEVPNEGGISNILHIRTHEYTDIIPPGNIWDLSCGDLDINSIELVFTAPGDDGWDGTVGIGYEVRFTPDTTFDPMLWAYVDVHDTIPPVPGRTEVHYVVDGLDSGRLYYFIVRAIDDDGPSSNPSDLAGCWTLGRVNPLPDIVMREDDPDTTIYDVPSIFNPPSGLAFDVISTVDGINAALVDSQDILISLDEDYYGEGWIIVTATDGEDVLYDSVHITIEPVNDAPQFITVPEDTLILDGYPWSYMAIATDVEGDPVSYGLISGPVGVEVDISGYASWLPSDIEGTYTIRIGAWDAGDTTIQEFDLVVIKHSHPVFIPQNLEAWDGFRDCVPVVWEAPPGVRGELPVHLSHYQLYRSEYYDIGYSVLVDSIPFNSYCDNSVDPGHLYFYKVKAIYREPDFNSGFSNIDGGASLASNWLYSSYTIATPPVVDGDLNEPVWFEATDTDLFGSFGLSIGNSGVALYIGLRSSSMTLIDGYKFRFFFDDDNSDSWDADSSTEGYYEVEFDLAAGESIVYFHPLRPDSAEPVEIAAGAVADWLGFEGSGFNVEMVIDMALPDEFMALPAETVGVAFQIVDPGGDTLLNWPSGADPGDPIEHANLVLGSPGGLPSLLISPPILIADAETGWDANGTIRLRNVGDGTIIWELAEDASWLEIVPESGVVPPGTVIEIDARFISGLLPVGIETTTIHFSSNDPIIPEHDLPVEFTITSLVPSHYLGVYPPAETNVESGEVVEIPIYIGEPYGNEIFQLDFTVMTDRDFMVPLGVLAGADLPASWTAVTRNIFTDRVLVRLYGPSPLLAEGELLKVRYAVDGDILAGRSSRIEVTDLLFNYGLEELPVPVPGNGVIVIGDNLRYFWFGMLKFFDDADLLQDSIRFGLLDAATMDYDRGVDVLNTPPHGTLLDAWFLSDDWKFLGTDIRPTGCEVEWLAWFEGDGRIEWDIRQMWPGFMIDGTIDMTVDSVYDVMPGVPVVISYDGTSGTFTWDIDIKRGWNLVSAPITAMSMSVSALFPSAVGAAWAWDPSMSNYIETPNIVTGEGCWILSTIDTSYSRTGDAAYSYERDLFSGWQLMGSPAHATYIADQEVVPADALVPGTFFYWDNIAEIPGYQSTDMFTPGLGQWVYNRYPSNITVTSIYLPKELAEDAIPATFEGRLFLDGVTGQRVEFAIGTAFDERPAPPPAPGTADRIYLDGGMPLLGSEVPSCDAMEWTGTVEIAKAKPLAWTLSGVGDATIEIDGRVIDMREEAFVEIGSGAHAFKVSYKRAVPEKLALCGNRPNPFNATTAIVFDLPQDAMIKLEIYDINGHKIRSLVDGELAAGSHIQVWEGIDESGRSMASGVYFAVLKTDGKSLQHKILLIK